jgi:hypothetical protein
MQMQTQTNLPTTHESNKRRLSDAMPLGHWSWSATVQYASMAMQPQCRVTLQITSKGSNAEGRGRSTRGHGVHDLRRS